MPIQNKSWLTGGASDSPMLRPSGSKSPLPSAYNWLKDQGFNYETYASGTSTNRPGTLSGGFSAGQQMRLADLRSALVLPDPVRTTQSILNAKSASAQLKIGQLQLEMIQPFDTLAQLTGSFGGLEQPLVGPNGSWFDPMSFLESKDMGNLVEAPSRLSDYALNTTVMLPFIIGQQLSGAPMPKINPKDGQYKFQESPGYWTFLQAADDEQLRSLAREVTGKYADPDTNMYLVEKLYNQFIIDRNKSTGLSSGNERTDFIAKKRLENYLDMGLLPKEIDGGASLAQASQAKVWDSRVMQLGMHDVGYSGFASFVPVIGTQLDKQFNPVKAQTEKVWASLTPVQRNALFEATGLYSMAAEFAGAMLVLAPAGVIAAGVKGTVGVGSNLLKAYDTVLNLSKASMAVGVTGATATWAAAAAFPDNEFIQGVTQRIDQSRPVSESQFAGVVNALGMFSSGTFGINTAVRMDARLLSKALGVAKVPQGFSTITRGVMSGMADLRTYSWGFGGSPMADWFVSNVGLPAQELKVGIQRVFMSESLNTVREDKLARIVGATDNPGASALGENMTTDQVLEVQAMQLARSMESTADDGEYIVRTMAKHREDQPLGLWVGGYDKIKEWTINARNARSWDDKIARRFVNQYGSAFIHRLTGADTTESMRTWMVAKLNQLGYKGDALPSAKAWNPEKWRQALRLVYHFDFNRWSDAVSKAAVGAEEAARISIMSMRHLFRDEADTALAILRGDDEAMAAAKMAELMDKVEVESWHATQVRYSNRAGEGAPVWEPTPKSMADHIEDIYETLSSRRHRPAPDSPEALDALNFVHGKMEDEGLWTIGYKPVNEAGDFVAAVHTRTGQVVQTRWLDYPLDNAWNVELGNRGLMAAKMDEVTRGFRTWRLLEFQKGSLFRSLSEKTDLTPSQIEAFHQGVMDIGRKHNVSPQAVGRMPGGRLPAPGLKSVSEEVNALAERVFGKDFVGKDGKVVNWRKEVGDAYRQSYRLNLTAGLTSHMKAHFGPVGEAITYGTDFMYVMWRFGMSPLFKAGEIWESAQLNLMRRVYPGDDPYVASLYVSTWGGDPGVAAMEATLDPFIAGMSSPAEATPGLRARISRASESVVNRQSGLVAEQAQRRAAAAFGFYARQLPEDQATAIARSAMREHAARYRAQAMGGEALRTTDRGRLMAELANSVDENGVLVAGADYTRLREVIRQLNREDLDPQVAAALDAHPWGVPSAQQIAHAADIRARADSLRATSQPVEPFIDSIQVHPEAGFVNAARLPAFHHNQTGYLFHALDHEGPAFDAIKAKGLQPDSNFVLGEPSGYGTIQLRIPADHPSFAAYDFQNTFAPGTILHGRRTTGTGARIPRIPVEDIEFFGADGAWHPLSAATAPDLIPVWRQMIADGQMAPDAALALRDRYDELMRDLRVEREANRAWRAGTLNVTTGGHPDLTDPITGLPVIRDALYSGESEFTTALRSLAQRRRNVKVTPPTAEDLAIRLETAAEASLSPRPIFRSERVGPRDSIPEGFTTDPAELYLEGEVNHSLDPAIGVNGDVWDANGNLIISTQSKEGVASWIDLNTHDPATAGLYHVTTAHDAVLDTGGLISRHENLIRSRPPEMVEALRQAYDHLPPSDIKFTMVSGGDIYWANHQMLNDFINGDIGYLADSFSGVKIFPSDVAEIRDTLNGVVLWKRPKGGVPRVPEGLSAFTIDQKVSFATTKEHSDTLVERYVIGGQAARGEITGQGVVDHYLPYYERLIQRGLDEGTYTLGTDIGIGIYPANRTVREEALMWLHKAVGHDFTGARNEAELYDSLLTEVLVDHYPMDPGKTQWALFNTLDRDLPQMKARVGLRNRKDVFSGAVTFVGGVQAARGWTRDQVAVLQVAVRGNRAAPLDIDEVGRVATEAFQTRPQNQPIGVILADGTADTWTRWTLGPQWAPDGSLIPVAERTMNGRTEEQAFQKWLTDLMGNARNSADDADQIVAVVAPASDETLLGVAPGDWDKRTSRGKDDLEVEVHSSNLYVIDDRIDAEPLATDAEGLLRQLRQVIDENGDVVPGYQKRHDQIVHDLTQLRAEAINPDPVARLEDIPEEPAGITKNLIERVRERGGKLNDEFWDPVPGKERKMDRLTVQMMREEFPRVTAGTGVEQVFRDMGIPEQQRADFLVTDRALLDDWTRTSDPVEKQAAFQQLVDHAGGTEDRASLDALYASEEWEVISGLWSLNFQGASEEAFGVHFFDQYRSPLLRSINHPVLGVYPAAWAVKTAREWAKFLFDNRMFGVDLRLGMSPAVAIAETARAQQVAFAQQNPEYDGTLEDFMREGPLGSTIFVFNLLMPGDWSALPFPLSRTLREVLRTWPNVNPGDVMAKNVQYMGVTRDLRLMSEMAYEAKDLLFPPEPAPNVPRPKTWTSTPKRSTPKWYDVPTR